MQENDMIEIVPTNQKYHYDLMKQNIRELKRAYPFLEMKTAGYSVLGKPIPYIKIGNGEKQVLYHASIHANEWITSPVLMKFIDEASSAYVYDSNLLGFSARELLNNVTIHLCPMVNPDGVDLVTGFLSNNSSGYRIAEKIASSYATIPFPDGWKANINGVDLKNYQPVCKVL